MNGCTKGDKEGEFTYIGGKEETVIDYVLGDRETKERIKKLVIGDRIN